MSEVSTVLGVIRGLGLVITSGIFHETFSSLETWFSVGGGGRDSDEGKEGVLEVSRLGVYFFM